MMKKIILTCAMPVIAVSVATSSMAYDVDAAPIHWGKTPINNTGNDFKNGKSFCSRKYVGKKTCIPAMNNTNDTLSVLTTEYNADNAPAGTAVALMGTGALSSVIFTVQDVGADGKLTTVYSGSANNREGIICNEDQNTKAITCNSWK